MRSTMQNGIIWSIPLWVTTFQRYYLKNEDQVAHHQGTLPKNPPFLPHRKKWGSGCPSSDNASENNPPFFPYLKNEDQVAHHQTMLVKIIHHFAPSQKWGSGCPSSSTFPKIHHFPHLKNEDQVAHHQTMLVKIIHCLPIDLIWNISLWVMKCLSVSKYHVRPLLNRVEMCAQ